MAKCKYCGETISRLDKEICPFCGGLKPLEGEDNSTQDFTKALESCEDMPVAKSKVIAAILAFVLGVFGMHAFYLGKYKIGLIALGITLVSVAGIGSILFFTVFHNALAFLIPYFVMEALMIGVGIAYLTRHDITDANGEFLR